MDANENMIKRKERIEWIDVAKGIAIVLVILGHSLEQENWMRMCIYSFHVPLFIIMSGFFYKDAKFFLFVWGSIKRFLVPYIVTLSAQYIIYVVLGELSWKAAMEKWFWTIIYSRGVPTAKVGSVGVLWFLTMLFGVRLLFWCVSRWCGENEKAKMLLILLIVLVGLWLTQEGGEKLWWLPWGVDLILVAVVFYYMGYVLKARGWIFEMVRDKRNIFLCCLIWGVGVLRGISLEFVWRSYPEGFICLIVAVAGSVVWCAVSYYLAKPALSRNIFSWMGRGSLVILCIHHLEKEVLPLGYEFSGMALFGVRLAVILLGYLVFDTGRRGIAHTGRKRRWLIKGG